MDPRCPSKISLVKTELSLVALCWGLALLLPSSSSPTSYTSAQPYKNEYKHRFYHLRVRNFHPLDGLIQSDDKAKTVSHLRWHTR